MKKNGQQLKYKSLIPKNRIKVSPLNFFDLLIHKKDKRKKLNVHSDVTITINLKLHNQAILLLTFYGT